MSLNKIEDTIIIETKNFIPLYFYILNTYNNLWTKKKQKKKPRLYSYTK